MFKDRIDAGQKLAEKLKEELSTGEIGRAIILAIPRGGIILGGEISRILNIPLDCLVTKKIPSPESEELAIGAISEDGMVVWEDELCERLKVSSDYKQDLVKKKIFELEDKQSFFRKNKPLPDIKNKTVILVDDGVATGATVKVSVQVIENFNPKEIILAVPVIEKGVLAELKEKFSKVIYLEAPEMFFSVGQFYEDFSQISDETVKKILNA